MSRLQLDGCTALVTGASAGIGMEFARELAPRVGGLVLVARREERLRQLRDELTARHPNLSVTIRATDLSDAADVDALCRWPGEHQIAIDILINNAGLGDYGTFATSDAARVREIIAVNMSALTMLAHALLPQMIARGRGGILNVSSSAAFLPLPQLALYAATKAYVNSLSEAVRLEVRGTGVHVTALCPGPVYTEFGDVAKRSGEDARIAPRFVHVSAQRVVRAALRALERNEPLVIPGIVMKVAMLITRAMPLVLLRQAQALSRAP